MIFILFLNIIGIFSKEIPCKKLYFYGNNIYNKAILSPVIIVGKLGMEIPVENGLYKATIDIKKVIKGSLGQWNQNILIAGRFSYKNDTYDLCQFNFYKEDSLYFLQVLSSQNGEYNVLFDSEIANNSTLELVNQTICNNCAKIPKLLIEDKSTTENNLVLDCSTDSLPPPKLQWTIPHGKNITVTEFRNGIRLNIKSVRNILNEAYICIGYNVLGEATSSMIIKTKITSPLDEVIRCAMNDKLLCNDHGKCYKDKIDGGKMFCRCDKGFMGTRCSDNPKKLSDDYLKRMFNVDEIFCNKNGEGYVNVMTKMKYCICNDKFFGNTCSKKIIDQMSEKGKMLRRNDKELSINDKNEFKRVLDEFSSKSTMKFILIGGGIVIGGCVVVLIITLILWKLCRRQTRRRKDDTDDRQSLGKTNTLISNNMRPITKFDDHLILLPANTEKSKVPTNSRLKNTFNDNQKIDDFNNYPGNGKYEGINKSQSTTMRVAL